MSVCVCVWSLCLCVCMCVYEAFYCLRIRATAIFFCGPGGKDWEILFARSKTSLIFAPYSTARLGTVQISAKCGTAFLDSLCFLLGCHNPSIIYDR